MSKTVKASVLNKYSTVAGKQGTIPATAHPDEGNWVDTDLFDGQALFNSADEMAYVRLGNSIKSWPIKGNVVPEGVTASAITIVDSRLIIPEGAGLTLEQLRTYYTIHVGGLELLTAEQTGLENQTTGQINFGTSIYDGAKAFVKKYGNP